jgi:hypothetical protein
MEMISLEFLLETVDMYSKAKVMTARVDLLKKEK